MDPLRSLLNLTEGKRHYIIDSDRVTQEEFKTAALMADVLWGQGGLAETLGSTWRMVHDPRFLRVEVCGIYDQKNMFSPGKKEIGKITVRSVDLFGNSGGSQDDMMIYVELLGEGRHFLKIVEDKGWNPRVQLSEEQIWELIKQESPNYQRKNGTWNREANRLHDLFAAGLISLVYDYAEVAYCTDWFRLDNDAVVKPGERIMVMEEDGVEVEDDIPIMAVEVDSLYRALNLRSQVRMTAYKLLAQFPGLKKDELDNLVFTDLESDAICQILFTTKFDKLYTALPKVMVAVKAAQARSYEERIATETAKLSDESRDFNAKLKSGEIEQIVTPIEEAPDGDPAVFMAQLTNNPYYAGLFTAIQSMEARGDEAARVLCEELVATRGAGDVWDRVAAFVKGGVHVDQDNLKALADTHGLQWKEKSEAQQMVLGENVHAVTTEVEGVFEGVNEQDFYFTYLNPHADPRGHHTAIVDLVKEDATTVRRTWSIAPEHYKEIIAEVPEGADIGTLPFRRTSNHNTGKISFEPAEGSKEV